MTQENKELLTQDLCARLPYGVKVSIHDEGSYEINAISKEGLISFSTVPRMYEIFDIKPYLFSISSMTPEQWEEYGGICNQEQSRFQYDKTYATYEGTDWLNSHHFDYRGLIEMGLAIDATNLEIYDARR